LHTASSAQATYITFHPKRGQAGTDDNDGVLTDFEVGLFMIVGRCILSVRIVRMLFVMCICYVSYGVWLGMLVRVGWFGWLIFYAG
jgi:hypothetical protein